MAAIAAKMFDLATYLALSAGSADIGLWSQYASSEIILSTPTGMVYARTMPKEKGIMSTVGFAVIVKVMVYPACSFFFLICKRIRI